MRTKKFFSHFIHFILFTAAFFSLTSCAFGRDKIHLEYSPRQTQCEYNTNSETCSAAVNIVVHDKRLRTQNLGCKGFGHDVDDIGIELENDLSDLIAKALRLELSGINENISSDFLVEVEIHRFMNEFKACGFTTGMAEAELILLVQVKHPAHGIVYSRVIVGKEQRDIQIALAYNAKFALEAALNDAIHQLFEDRTFCESLQGML